MDIDRVLRIDGASNFREFGRYRGHAGRSLVEARLYRSAHLANVTREGLDAIRRLGIATVIDLRGVREGAAAPAAFAADPDIRFINAPIEPASTPRIRALVAEGRATGAAIRDVMLDGYRRYVREEATQFGRAFAALAAGADAPILVHCTAGKDRTGFTVAVLQSLAGVSRLEVLADYEATNRHWDRALSVSQALPIAEEAREALLAADPAYLEAAFDEIRARHGSVEGFAAAAMGEASLVERLRETLLAAAPRPEPMTP
jgi:protein-tyrosine phosphatase